VDFSDRIGDKRKSYRVPSRRRRNRIGISADESSRSSDDEDEEFEEKVARLRREVEEVRVEAETREAEKDRPGGKSTDQGSMGGGDKDVLAQLSDVLRRVQASSDASIHRRRLSMGSQQGERGLELLASYPDGISATVADEPDAQTAMPVHYRANEDTQRVLSIAADFEARMASLEDALGINTTALAHLSTTQSSKPILPALDLLEKQISILSTTTIPSLDSMQRQIQQLTEASERLTEARKAATAAQEARKEKSASASATTLQEPRGEDTPPGALPEDPELTVKIDALYTHLPTIETLGPLLPSVLERLRSLHILHANAAAASEALTALEQRQAQMSEELGTWREGLERVEKAVRRGGEVSDGNMEVVEGWVRDLERRVEEAA